MELGRTTIISYSSKLIRISWALVISKSRQLRLLFYLRQLEYVTNTLMIPNYIAETLAKIKQRRFLISHSSILSTFIKIKVRWHICIHIYKYYSIIHCKLKGKIGYLVLYFMMVQGLAAEPNNYFPSLWELLALAWGPGVLIPHPQTVALEFKLVIRF